MILALAGAEVAKYRRLLAKQGCSAFYLSYLYLRTLRNNGRDALQSMREEYPHAKFFVNSGADFQLYKYLCFRCDILQNGESLYPHTITSFDIEKSRASNAGVYRHDVRAAMRAYHREYANWLAQSAHLIDAYDDCNIAPLLSDELDTALSEFWTLRQRLYEGLPQENNLIFCPQLDRADDIKKLFGPDWRACVKYIGLMQHPIRTKEFATEFFHNHMPALTAQKARVHLFRCLHENLAALPFASASSGGWLYGAKFGTVFKYLGQFRIQQIPATLQHMKQGLFSEVQEAGVSFEDFVANNHAAVNAVNALQWVKLQQDLATQHRFEYWNTQTERTESTSLARSAYRTDLARTRHNYANTPAKANDAPAMTVGRYCNTCVLQDRCPVFQPDTTCAVTARPSVRNGAELQDVISSLIEIQMERVQFATFAERVSGHVLDAATSKEVKEAIKLIERARNVVDNRDTVTVTAKGGGILTRLFASSYGRNGQARSMATVPDEEILDEHKKQ